MRRRQFITLLGGAAAWPPASWAQQPAAMRRIGVLMNTTSDDVEGQARIAAFVQRLQQLGWTGGHNAQIDIRWGGGAYDRFQQYAAELVAQKPDVILAAAGTALAPLHRETKIIPIVFAQTPDPVGAGYVASMSRPGGNVTGFTQLEYGLTGKWLELLKQIAPNVNRGAVLRDPGDPAGIGQWAAIHVIAPLLGVEMVPIDARDPTEIERAITDFARSSNGGLIVTASSATAVHRQRIVLLAARHRLPAIYPFRYFITSGGLFSYGPDTIEPYRRAAEYVDRILKGEKPADLPVQAPTRYDLVINLKTAKALDIDVPPLLLARADEVIE
jgi:ABC-type uncharacterized transport system substrate-binding protein